MSTNKLFAQKANQINPVELLIGIGLATAAIILFNVYPEALGLVPEEDAWFPFLDPAFAVHIPWLTASWGLEIGLKLVLLVEGRWHWHTRLVEFLLSLFGVYIAYRILNGGPIAAFSVLNWPIRLALWIAVIVGSIVAAVQLLRLVVGWPDEEEPLPSQPA